MWTWIMLSWATLDDNWLMWEVFHPMPLTWASQAFQHVSPPTPASVVFAVCVLLLYLVAYLQSVAPGVWSPK